MAQFVYLQITLPTRFSDRNCTLIDNFLCKLTRSFLPSASGILISRISYHMPYFIFLGFIKSKQYDTAKTILVQNWNAVNIENFQNELNNASIYDALDNSLVNDPSNNLDIINNLKSQTKTHSLPQSQINKHKHKKSRWITNGLLRSISYRDKLYVKLKRLPADTERHTNLKINLQIYQSILKKVIRDGKKKYYQKQYLINFKTI